MKTYTIGQALNMNLNRQSWARQVVDRNSAALASTSALFLVGNSTHTHLEYSIGCLYCIGVVLSSLCSVFLCKACKCRGKHLVETWEKVLVTSGYADYAKHLSEPGSKNAPNITCDISSVTSIGLYVFSIYFVRLTLYVHKCSTCSFACIGSVYVLHVFTSFLQAFCS